MMFADQVVAEEFVRTFYGNRLWSDMTEEQKAQAVENCLSESRQLQQNVGIAFYTILRLRREIDAVDPPAIHV